MKRAAWVGILIFMSIGAMPVWSDVPLVDDVGASDGQEDDYFGASVSISSDVCIIGADEDDNGGVNTGSAYVFRFEDPNWVEEVKLTAFDGQADDFFGGSVSVSGDVCVIGARGDDDNGDASGSAYLYYFNGSEWVYEEKLIASDGAELDRFGWSVSISGDVCIVGAKNDYDNGNGSGSAYIFRFDGGQWVEEQKLTASDGATLDNFGYSVSMGSGICLVGAWADDGYAGAAYVFRYNEPNWVEEAKLVASDWAEDDWFGTSVAIDDDVCVVGAVGDDDDGPQSGSAYVFRFSGSTWIEESKLTASDGTYYDGFGESVSIKDGVCVVSAPRNPFSGDESGSVYIFRYNDPNWVQADKVTAFDGDQYDYFGSSVSIDSRTVVVGADGKAWNTGGAYMYAVEMCPAGDISGDCQVNLADFAKLADEWLTVYDMDDLVILAQQWLDG